MPTPHPALLARLRAQMDAQQPRLRHGVLPFGDGRVDACLAGGGLVLGALHEVAGAGIEAETGATPAAFLACLLARLPGRKPLVWIAPTADLYAPGLLAHGLDPGRLLRVRPQGDPLAAMETVLRDGTTSGVVAEAGRLSRIASRRLQLACLKHGSTGFVLRRWPYGRGGAAEEPTASVTRWRIAPAPSAIAFGEPGPPRWRVELLHARGGFEGAWIMQAGEHNAPHPVCVVAELADPAAPTPRRALG